MPADQIEQWKKVDPDDVDKVPVQSGVFDGRMVFLGITPAPRQVSEGSEQAYTDDHVQGVHPGHCEIERKEQLGMLGIGFQVRVSGNRCVECERRSRYVMVVKLFLVLDRFDTQKCES